MRKLGILFAVLVATLAGAAPDFAQTQPAPEYIYPPLSYPQRLYYQQNPQEFQQLLERLPKPSHEIVPGAQLAPGQAPVGGTWTSLAHPNGQSMSNPLLLTDGTVIAHVSCTGNWFKLTPDNTGSYINGTWTAIASMPAGYAPRFFGSAVLPDGRVIAMGGEYNGTGCNPVDTTLGAIYDPVANAWTTVNPPSGWGRIGDASGIVLANGTYMQTSCCDSPPVAALLNPSTLTWTSTGTGKFDVYDEEAVALLPNGSVLTVDAYVFTGTCATNSEAYNPATGAWTSAGSTVIQQSDCSGKKSFEVGPLVMRPDGTAVSFSGVTTGTTQTAIYNTGTNTWAAGPVQPSVGGVPYTMADAPAAVLPNGNVLAAMSPSNWAASNSFPSPTHYFELNLSTNTFTQVADKADAASFPSFEANFLVLPTGQVMAFSTDGPTVQVYTPAGTFQPSWQPVVNSVPSCVNPGGTYAAFGTQFNGLTQGAYYGDDVQAWTNYPLIRIVNNGTGHVFYTRTSAFSTMSIAPGTFGSANFAVPAGIETGSSTLFVVANGIPSAGTPLTVTAACAAPPLAATHDFNGDHMSDIAWRQSGGAAAAWLMNGPQILQTCGFGVVTTNWQIVGQRDFNADSRHDWLWRDNNSGTVAMWLLNGLQVVQTANVATVGLNWTVAGTSDFNGDHKGDLLWRDFNSGTVAIWLMNGPQIVQTGTIGVIPLNWTIVATDGTGHIFWRDSNTGTVAIWTVNNFQVVQTTSLGAVPLNWTIVGVGDFDGNGSTDILWRDSNTGTVAIWLLNGLQFLQAGNLGAVPGNWSVAVTGDFNGDTKSDLLWRDSNSGTVAIWFMNGLQIASTANLGAVTTDWVIQGTNAE